MHNLCKMSYYGKARTKQRHPKRQNKNKQKISIFNIQFENIKELAPKVTMEMAQNEKLMFAVPNEHKR